MPLNITIVNPNIYNNWDELVSPLPDSTFFHSSEWSKVLCDSYRYKPLYFSELKNNQLLSLIPVIEVDSVLTGRRGVSLPFTDFCDPLVCDQDTFSGILKVIVEYGKKRGWKYLEFRTKHKMNLLEKSDYFVRYYDHDLSLCPDYKKTFTLLKNTTRRNIKKACNEGVTATVSYSYNAIKEFYRLHSITRKKHGIPPQPFSFFKKIYDTIIAIKSGYIVLGHFHDTVVAAAVYFCFGNKIIYKYGASDQLYHNLRPNNLVMWESIKWACQNGYSHFNFGRTELDNQGLRRFKAGWGTEEKEIHYYRYDINRNLFTASCDDRLMSLQKFIFGNLPVPLLKIAGTLLYRHAG